MKILQHAVLSHVKHAVSARGENSEMTQGERIKHRRLELKLSVIAVAKGARVTKSAVYQWEANEVKNIEGKVLVPLAETLKTYERWIVFGEGPKERGAWVALDPEESALLLAYRALRSDSRQAILQAAVQLSESQKKKGNSG